VSQAGQKSAAGKSFQYSGERLTDSQSILPNEYEGFRVRLGCTERTHGDASPNDPRALVPDGIGTGDVAEEPTHVHYPPIQEAGTFIE
jgi:hypothetical protein